MKSMLYKKKSFWISSLGVGSSSGDILRGMLMKSMLYKKNRLDRRGKRKTSSYLSNKTQPPTSLTSLSIPITHNDVVKKMCVTKLTIPHLNWSKVHRHLSQENPQP